MHPLAVEWEPKGRRLVERELDRKRLSRAVEATCLHAGDPAFDFLLRVLETPGSGECARAHALWLLDLLRREKCPYRLREVVLALQRGAEDPSELVRTRAAVSLAGLVPLSLLRRSDQPSRVESMVGEVVRYPQLRRFVERARQLGVDPRQHEYLAHFFRLEPDEGDVE